MAFVGWLTLFTAQVVLIRKARPDLHRRMGKGGAMLAAAGLTAAGLLLRDKGRPTSLYLGSDILMLGLGAYDLATRGRLG